MYRFDFANIKAGDVLYLGTHVRHAPTLTELQVLRELVGPERASELEDGGWRFLERITISGKPCAHLGVGSRDRPNSSLTSCPKGQVMSRSILIFLALSACGPIPPDPDRADSSSSSGSSTGEMACIGEPCDGGCPKGQTCTHSVCVLPCQVESDCPGDKPRCAARDELTHCVDVDGLPLSWCPEGAGFNVEMP